MAVRTIVIAGLCSGSGKTSIAVGLSRCLRDAGHTVATFKVGPDYLDPTYLAAASGRPCHNLDPWMMGKAAVLQTFADATADADYAVVEGVMGLFDGVTPTDELGSTAQVAKWLGAAVVLCMDASGMSTTFAAMAIGAAHHDVDLAVAGVVANRVGSVRHGRLLEAALRHHGGPAWLGSLSRGAAPGFPARHLGLQTASYGGVSEASISSWAHAVRQGVHVAELCSAVAASSESPQAPLPDKQTGCGRARCTVAVARDAAFHFYYPWNLSALQRAGAELVEFSPLADRRLPPCEGVLLGGGYPEVFASELSANHPMLEALRGHVNAGKPTLGECGGFMYLTQFIEDGAGDRHATVGAVSGGCRLTGRLAALGYVEAKSRSAGVLGGSGQSLYGHEFRYSERVGGADDALAVRRVRDGQAAAAGVMGRGLFASYLHCHWARTPEIPVRLVKACLPWRAPRSP